MSSKSLSVSSLLAWIVDLTGNLQCWDNRVRRSGSYDHTIRVWDTATASASRTIYGSKRVISCLDYSVAAQRIGEQDADCIHTRHCLRGRVRPFCD